MFVLSYSDRGTARRHALSPGETLIGRLPSSTLPIDDSSISRRHAKMILEDDRCRVVDLASRNGTYLNGELVAGEALVSDGDTVTFGTVAVKVERSAEEQLSLGEGRGPVDVPGTIYLRVGDAPRGEAVAPRQVDARQLLAMVSEVSRMLVRAEPLLTILNRVVDLVFEAVPAERAFLILADPVSGTLVPRVVRKRDGELHDRATVSRTILNRVITDRVAILSQDAQVDAQLAAAPSVYTENVRSFMCAPLWNQSDVIGVFYVDTPYSNEFAAAHLDLFAAMSDYVAVAVDQARLAASVVEETRRRERLQRYHSPAVVERILHGPDESGVFALPQERDVTIVFADLVGFTTMSEKMTAIDVTRMLNRYLRRMTDVIFEHEGTLDKFVGDAILAVFGAPLEQPDHPLRAIRAAQAMREALRRLNEEDSSGEPLQIRIGINSGPVTAGDIGSPRRREYTVLGDTVNTCARLQTAVCKPGQIVISRSVYDRVHEVVPATALGFFKVKGREREVEAFAV